MLNDNDGTKELPFVAHRTQRRAWRRFRAHRLAALGLGLMVILVGMAVFAPVIAPIDPFKIDCEAGRYQPPNADHWLGTDGVCRDMWSRLVYGGRISLSVGLVAVTVQLLIGSFLGAIAGYYGGLMDTIIMRLTDLFLTLPTIVLCLAIVSVLEPSIYNVMGVIGLVGWGQICRLMRGQLLSLRENEYIIAARCIGARDQRIIFRHLLPNIVGPLTVAATFGVASAMLQEAALSYLGLGVQIPTSSWGNMLTSAKSVGVLTGMPWIWTPPGLMIVISVLSINFIGDGLRDALDPRGSVD